MRQELSTSLTLASFERRRRATSPTAMVERASPALRHRVIPPTGMHAMRQHLDLPDDEPLRFFLGGWMPASVSKSAISCPCTPSERERQPLMSFPQSSRNSSISPTLPAFTRQTLIGPLTRSPTQPLSYPRTSMTLMRMSSAAPTASDGVKLTCACMLGPVAFASVYQQPPWYLMREWVPTPTSSNQGLSVSSTNTSKPDETWDKQSICASNRY